MSYSGDQPERPPSSAATVLTPSPRPDLSLGHWCRSRSRAGSHLTQGLAAPFLFKTRETKAGHGVVILGLPERPAGACARLCVRPEAGCRPWPSPLNADRPDPGRRGAPTPAGMPSLPPAHGNRSHTPGRCRGKVTDPDTQEPARVMSSTRWPGRARWDGSRAPPTSRLALETGQEQPNRRGTRLRAPERVGSG